MSNEYTINVKPEITKLVFPGKDLKLTFQNGTKLNVSTEVKKLVFNSDSLKIVKLGQAPDWTFQTKITVSASAPNAPRVGDVWFDIN